MRIHLAILGLTPLLLPVVNAAGGEPAGAAVGDRLSVADFGAAGDGKTRDTQAIQRAIDAAHGAGGGTVYFPAGTYLSGTIYLKSRVHIHLDHTAVLLGSTEQSDYPVNRCNFPSYTDKYVTQALIWGEDLHDIGITGRGTIDGQGAAFAGLPWRERPYLIRFITCRNIVVEDVTLRHSAMWMQHYLACDFVTVRGITVYNHGNANNDMIDIDCCRDVILSDCFADSDDDALTFKSTADRACENITVSNCVLSSHCNAIKMGTESNGGFKNISITNCAIRPSRDPGRQAGRTEGLAGIALEIVDGGTLDGVTISNIAIVGTSAPLFLRLGNRARAFAQGMTRPDVGSFRNVVISNIVATDAGNTGCSITGLPGHAIGNVTMSNIKLQFAGGGTVEDATRPVPELAEKYPECTMFGTLPAWGFYCRHVDGLTLRDIDLRFIRDDRRPALVCDDVRNLRVDGLAAQAAADAAPPIVLRDVRGATISGCTAPAGLATFLKVEGAAGPINVIGNDLRGAVLPFQLSPETPPSALYHAANARGT